MVLNVEIIDKFITLVAFSQEQLKLNLILSFN